MDGLRLFLMAIFLLHRQALFQNIAFMSKYHLDSLLINGHSPTASGLSSDG